MKKYILNLLRLVNNNMQKICLLLVTIALLKIAFVGVETESKIKGSISSHVYGSVNSDISGKVDAEVSGYVSSNVSGSIDTETSIGGRVYTDNLYHR